MRWAASAARSSSSCCPTWVCPRRTWWPNESGRRLPVSEFRWTPTPAWSPACRRRSASRSTPMRARACKSCSTRPTPRCTGPSTPAATRSCTPPRSADSLHREHRTRVEQVLRVQRRLDLPVHAHADRADLARQPVLLDLADAVLAGHRAAQRKPQVEDVVEGLPRPAELVLGAGVVDDRRMHVAVACVADHGDAQAHPLADPLT